MKELVELVLYHNKNYYELDNPTISDKEYDKLYGFDVGIDDYVTKPFSPKELVARIKANLKRNTIMNEEISYLGLKIDTLGHNVYVDDKKINLTNKEYELLLYLIKNKNIVLIRE